jgi:hypothetical protein
LLGVFLFDKKPPAVSPFAPAVQDMAARVGRPPPPAAASSPPLSQAGPPAPSIRDRYQEQSYEQLGLTREEFETMDPLERNTLITGAYARMYAEDPDAMKWAGMAAFASDTAGVGMMGAGAMDLVPGGPDGDELENLLAQGNGELYQDIYWQHMAFQQGGLEELQQAAEAGEVQPAQLAAWAAIAEGKEALAEAKASRDPEAIQAAKDRIWQGNGDLLQYEQQVFLQKHVYDQSPDTFTRMTDATGLLPGGGMPSPIPGGESFQDYRDRTDAPGGRADAGDVTQRWDWISNSMLPSFRDLDENRHGEMVAYMDRFQDNAESGQPGVPQLGRLTGRPMVVPRLDETLRLINSPYDRMF